MSGKNAAVVTAATIAALSGRPAPANAENTAPEPEGAKVEMVTNDAKTTEIPSDTYDASQDFGVTSAEAVSDNTASGTNEAVEETVPTVNMEALQKALANSDNLTQEDIWAIGDAQYAIKKNPQDINSQKAFKLMYDEALKVTNKFVMADQYYDFSYLEGTNYNSIEKSYKTYKGAMDELIGDEEVRKNIPEANIEVVNNKGEDVAAESFLVARYYEQHKAKEEFKYNRADVLNGKKDPSIFYKNPARCDDGNVAAYNYGEALLNQYLEEDKAKKAEYNAVIEKFEKEYYLETGVIIEEDDRRAIIYNKSQTPEHYCSPAIQDKNTFKDGKKIGCVGGTANYEDFAYKRSMMKRVQEYTEPEFPYNQNTHQEILLLNRPDIKDEVYSCHLDRMINNSIYKEGSTSKAVKYCGEQILDYSVDNERNLNGSYERKTVQIDPNIPITTFTVSPRVEVQHANYAGLEEVRAIGSRELTAAEENFQGDIGLVTKPQINNAELINVVLAMNGEKPMNVDNTPSETRETFLNIYQEEDPVKKEEKLQNLERDNSEGYAIYTNYYSKICDNAKEIVTKEQAKVLAEKSGRISSDAKTPTTHSQQTQVNNNTVDIAKNINTGR